MPEDPFASLIPELKLWDEGRGIDVESWITCVGTFEHAIGYSTLFWPTFVIHEEAVLRAGFSIASYRGFMEQTGGRREAVEAVLNHVHIVNLFGINDPAMTPTRDQVVYLGRVLREMWQAKLARDFPDRQIVVAFFYDEHEDLSDYELTVYQAA